MAFWIFACNPDQYRLTARLTDLNPETCWRVTRFRDLMSEGDTAFIWETGTNRGIRAVMQLTRTPCEMLLSEPDRPYTIAPDAGTRLRVAGNLTHRIDLPASVLRGVEGLEELAVFHGDQRRTNFPVTPEQGAILMRLVSESVPAEPVAASDSAGT